MTPKQKTLAAVSRSHAVRPPLFYRDTPGVERRLCEDLGLADREALLRELHIDFRWISPDYVGPPQVDEQSGRRKSIWGIEYEFVRIDVDGYWKAIANPLLDATDPAALNDYSWPTPELFDFSSLPAQVSAYRNYAVMTAPGDASTGILSVAQDLLGMERALSDPLVRPKFFDKLIDKILEFKLPFVERMVTAADGGLDFFRIGDDFGTQRGMLMSVDQWRTSLRPALLAIVDTAKRCGARYYYHHSCGSVCELIPYLIENGADVLDPLQIRARGMDPARLKQDFGARICFSGGIDQQETLRRGTPDEVRKAVNTICDIMAPGGGYFVGPTHNFQADIPTENIVAMYEAAREWEPN